MLSMKNLQPANINCSLHGKANINSAADTYTLSAAEVVTGFISVRIGVYCLNSQHS